MPRAQKKPINPAVDTFADRLHTMMLAKGWNQAELARRAGVGRDTISGYINGNHMPDPGNVAKLVQAFGCTAADLFPEVEGARAALPTTPAEFRQMPDGTYHIRLDLQGVSMEAALQIMKLARAAA